MSKNSPRIITPNFTPRPYQKEFLRNVLIEEYKRVLMIIHRRAGKDTTAFNLCWMLAIQRPALYLYLLPKIKQSRTVIWRGRGKDGVTFLDRIPKPLIAGKPNNTSQTIELINGSIIMITGADNYDALAGTNPYWVFISEIQNANPLAWELILRPILSENGGGACLFGTPRGHNHLYDMYETNKDNPDWYTPKLTVDDTTIDGVTPVISPEMIEAERRAGMSNELINQEYYCLPSGSRIQTDKGCIDIEDIKLGDVVLTHTGRFRKVIKLYEHEIDSELISIKTYGNYKPLKLTGNHKVRTLNPQTQSYNWVCASQINPGDFLCMPKLNNGQSLATPLLSKALVKLIGWYLCEGSFIKNAIQITLSKKEDLYQKEVCNLAKSLGLSVSIHQTITATSVAIKNTSFCDFLIANCGSLSHEKRIPLSLIAGQELCLYETMMNGDGCVAKTKYETWDSFTTTSIHLAHGVQLLASTLGYKAGISKRKAGRYNIEGRDGPSRESYSVQVRKTKGGQKIRPAKNSVGVCVRAVQTDKFIGKVYNIGVQHDESYIADGRTVHNCSFDAAIQGAYYSEQLQEMESAGRISDFKVLVDQPVHTSWDIGVRDYTSIGFFQMFPDGSLRCIYHMEGPRTGAQDWILKMRQAQKQLRFKRWGLHFLPHDVRIMEWGGGRTRVQVLQKAGVNPRIVGNHRVADRIQATRTLMPKMWIHKSNCKQLVRALKEYHSEYDEKKGIRSTAPAKSWANHAADMFGYFCVGYAETYDKPQMAAIKRYASFMP